MTNPLYDNTETQFKDWPEDVQNEFFQATAVRGEDWQAFDASYKRWSNGFRYCPSFNPNHIYRLVRPEPEPLVVPWEVFEDDFVCAAVDAYDDLWLARSNLSLDFGVWTSEDVELRCIDSDIIKFERGNLPWQETKTWRPGHEPEGDE